MDADMTLILQYIACIIGSVLMVNVYVALMLAWIDNAPSEDYRQTHSPEILPNYAEV